MRSKIFLTSLLLLFLIIGAVQIISARGISSSNQSNDFNISITPYINYTDSTINNSFPNYTNKTINSSFFNYTDSTINNSFPNLNQTNKIFNNTNSTKKMISPRKRIKIIKRGNKIKLQREEYPLSCKNCNISENGSLIRATFSNGRNAEIKIMPNVVSKIALERLRLRNCTESNNCTIELKEIGEGEEIRMIYSIKAEKEAKLFGIFKSKMNLETEIDAETGEIIKTKRPWWSFFSTEEEVTEEI